MPWVFTKRYVNYENKNPQKQGEKTQKKNTYNQNPVFATNIVNAYNVVRHKVILQL